MIVNIRGTSGSGKSTLVRLLMERSTRTDPLIDKSRKPEGYVIKVPTKGTISIVGSYENDCGGCDGIKTQDEVCRRVRDWSRVTKNVVFEGLLVSDIYARYAALALELGGPKTVKLLFLDTPLDVCIKRVEDRRERKGKPREFDHVNTEQKWNNQRRNFDKFVEEGLEPVWIDHRDPLPALLKVLV